MNGELSEWLGFAILVFCRVGACVMIMPGIGTIRIPPHVRLYIALAISLVLLPICREYLPNDFPNAPIAVQGVLILSELATGFLIGLLARVFFAALHFSLMMIATLIGFPAGSTTSVLEGEPSTPLADALSIAAVVAFFSIDGHIELIRALVQSFTSLPAQNLLESRFAVSEIARLLSVSFVLAIQLAAPFIIYSLIVNLLMGVATRMAPQMPMQFVGGPIILFGGLVLFGYLTLPMLSQFLNTFGRWLSTG
jgi:flagellar biosynthetic protein FliR